MNKKTAFILLSIFYSCYLQSANLGKTLSLNASHSSTYTETPQEDCFKHLERRNACVQACVEELGEDLSRFCAEAECEREARNFERCQADPTLLSEKLAHALSGADEGMAAWAKHHVEGCHNHCSSEQGMLGGLFDSQATKDRIAACKDSCDYGASEALWGYQKPTITPTSSSPPANQKHMLRQSLYDTSTTAPSTALQQTNVTVMASSGLGLSREEQNQQDPLNYAFSSMVRSPSASAPTTPADCTQHTKRAVQCVEDCNSRNPTSSKNPTNNCAQECRTELRNVESCKSSALPMEQRLTDAEQKASKDRVHVERETARTLGEAQCNRMYRDELRNILSVSLRKAKVDACLDRNMYDSIERMEEDARTRPANELNTLLDQQFDSPIKNPVLRTDMSNETTSDNYVPVAYKPSRSTRPSCQSTTTIDSTIGQCKAKPINRVPKSVHGVPTKSSSNAPSVPSAFGLSRAQQNKVDVQRYASGQLSAPRPQADLKRHVEAQKNRTTQTSNNREKTFEVRPVLLQGQTLGRQPNSSPSQSQDMEEANSSNSEADSKKLQEENAILKSELNKIINETGERLKQALKSPFRPIEDVLNSDDPFIKFEYGVDVGIAIASKLFKHDAGNIIKFGKGTYKLVGGFCKGDPLAVLEGLDMLTSIGDEGDGRPDPATLAILDAIAQLSKQMAEYQEQIMARFDRTDKFHEITLRTLARNFFSLHQETGDIRQALKNISEQARENFTSLQSNISATHAALERSHSAITDNLSALRIEEIDEHIQAADKDAEKKHLADADFAKHTDVLMSKAVTRAAAPHLTGGNVDETNIASIQGSWGNKSNELWQHPIFARTNLLSKYLAKHAGTIHTPMVNPLIWHQCAQTIIKLFDKKLDDAAYPADPEQQAHDIAKLQALHAEGEKIIAFIKQCTAKDGPAILLREYQQCHDTLKALIQEQQKAYEQERIQELCALHCKDSEAERNYIATMPAECSDCVKVTQKTIQKVQDDIVRAGKVGFSVRGVAFMHDKVKKCIAFNGNRPTSEITELLAAKATDLPTHQTVKLKAIYKKQTTFLQERDKKLSENLKAQLKLTNLNAWQSVQKNGISSLIYPADKTYTLVLLMPDTYAKATPIDPSFMQAEQVGLGKLHHRYSITGNQFHVHTYFYENDGTQYLIRDVYQPYTPSKLYNNDENVQHFWYGGRFAKDTDQVSYVTNDGTLTNYSLMGETLRARNTGDAHYPPLTEYPAASNVPVQTVPLVTLAYDKTHINKIIQDFYAQERRNFCSRVAAQAEPSRTKIYKAIQELDVKFKLLEGLLTFMYNELMYTDATTSTMRDEFVRVTESGVTYLKDGAAINRYLEEYADPNTALSQQEFALQHLAATKKSIEQTFDGILGLKLTAGFQQVESVLDHLHVLMQTCYGRHVIPITIDTKNNELVLLTKQLEQRDREIAQRDKQIVLLTEDRTHLTQVVENTQKELHDIRKLLMDLLAKK